MKKTLVAGLVLCAVLNLGIIVAPTSACIGADGKPVEGTNGDVTNCVVDVEPEEIEPFTVSVEEIDFGYFSEVGRTYTQTFVLANNTDETVAVKLAAEKPDYEGLADENTVGVDWINFVGGVKYFEIAANTTKTVGVRVVVPADAKAGSQYAVIKAENTTKQITKYIDVRMAVATEGIAFGGEVAKSDARPIGIDDKLHASITVKNSGNAGFEAKYTVRVVAKFGSDLKDWKEIVKEKTAVVYPGSEKRFVVPDDAEAIGYGLFTVEQKVVYVNANGEQIEEVSTRTVLNLPLWLLIVIGGVIVLIVVVIVVVKIVKKKKAGDDDEDDEEEEEKPKKVKKAKKDKKEAKGKGHHLPKKEIESELEDEDNSIE